MMDFCGVLHNGKSQSCAADLFGTALIHTVKAFKNTFLVFRPDSDSGIRYGEGNRCIGVLHADMEIPLPAVWGSIQWITVSASA